MRCMWQHALRDENQGQNEWVTVHVTAQERKGHRYTQFEQGSQVPPQRSGHYPAHVCTPHVYPPKNHTRARTHACTHTGSKVLLLLLLWHEGLESK